ncbi:MAG: NFACT family protein [Blastocatellia bacterium]|nr:NFACT family protein [Blastocatellia bacterium]
MENFLLTALVQELADLLKPRESLPIGKIFSLGATSLALDLRLPDGRLLVLAANPADTRFYLTSRSPRELEALAGGEPAFVQRIRKELSGHRLTAIEKPPQERSVLLSFTGYDAAGALRTTKLCLDLTGRSSNLYWMGGDNRILDALRVTDSVAFGERHSLAEDATQLDWEAITETTLTEPVEATLRRIRGCSPTLVREILARAQTTSVWPAFAQVRTALSHKPEALLYSRIPLHETPIGQMNPRENLRLGTFSLMQCAGWHLNRFPNLHAAVDAWFHKLDGFAAFTSARQPWQSALTAHLKRTVSALEKVARETTRLESADTWRKFGELIYANIKTGCRTQTGLVVIDYYETEQPEIEIPVEAHLPLTVAAQKYFQRYQKAQRAAVSLAERLQKLTEAKNSTETALELLREAATPEELAELIPTVEAIIPFELRPKIKNQKSKIKNQNSLWSGFRRYRGPEGFEIVVGRNSRDNDRLTFKLARPADVWLHTMDYPGSHVLIRNEKRLTVPHHVLVAAAELAAYFSQAKNDDKVNVHFTERKYLSRPRNAAPGLVLLQQSKTLLVTPREALERIQD